MGLKAKIEAIIYAAEEPITLEQMALLVKDIVLAEEAAAQARAAENTSYAVDDEPILSDEAGMAEADAAPPEAAARKRKSDVPKKELSEDARVRAYLRPILEQLVADYQADERGIEVRQIAGGYKMATKPEHHDVVRAFAKSLKPTVRLSLAALETLAVIAYKQPVTIPEISEIRGVESGGVIATLLDRKLITTAGRKQVIGRPILYKTSKDFLMRFGLNDISELPSMEEFEKLASDQADLFSASAGSAASAQPPIEESSSSNQRAADEQSSDQIENAEHEASTANNG